MVDYGRRGEGRDHCEIEASIFLPEKAEALPCVIVDISENGAKLTLDPSIDLAPRFTLALPLVGDVRDERCVDLRWRKGVYVGVRFLKA